MLRPSISHLPGARGISEPALPPLELPLEPLSFFTKTVAVLSPSVGKAEIHPCPTSSPTSALTMVRCLLRLDLFPVLLPRCTGASSPLVPQNWLGQLWQITSWGENQILDLHSFPTSGSSPRWSDKRGVRQRQGMSTTVSCRFENKQVAKHHDLNDSKIRG
jgi:hypothetical protein